MKLLIITKFLRSKLKSTRSCDHVEVDLIPKYSDLKFLLIPRFQKSDVSKKELDASNFQVYSKVSYLKVFNQPN